MPKILVVDDDLAVLTVVAHGLRQAGYQVVQVDNSVLALNICKHEQPDLAILDMVMPGMGGLELASLLKNETSTPFIFLSSYGDDSLVRSAIEVGALGYLVKPVEVSRIVPAIEAALSRADRQEPLRTGNADLDDVARSSRNIDLAMSFIMQSRGLDRAEAFEWLREEARSHPGGIEELAKQYLEHIAEKSHPD
jgi:DNA-binding response OmpR family regulator